MAFHSGSNHAHNRNWAVQYPFAAYFTIVVVAAAAVPAAAAAGVQTFIEQRSCPEQEFVYLMNSNCWMPVRFHQPLQFLSVAAEFPKGGLKPFNESGNTSSIHFTGSSSDAGSAKYAVRPLAATGGAFITLNTPVVIYNTESGRMLGWQQWGTKPSLVETLPGGDRQVLAKPAVFRFAKAEQITLPCIRIAGARCEAYYLLSSPSPTVVSRSGWVWEFSAWHRDTLIFPAAPGSLGEVPLILTRI